MTKFLFRDIIYSESEGNNIKVITIYEALDGTQFQDEENCRRYEKECGFYYGIEGFHLYNSVDEDITIECKDDPDLTANQVEWLIIDTVAAVDSLKALFRAGDSSTLGIDSPGRYYWDYYDCKWRKEND